jgi:hypothetical protein
MDLLNCTKTHEVSESAAGIFITIFSLKFGCILEVIIENIPSRCAISAKLGTHDYKIGINKYPGNAGEISWSGIKCKMYDIMNTHTCVHLGFG